jgi:threonine synthase
MVTHTEENVHVFACEGTSDDLDVPVKAILTDKDFSKKHNIGSINSINLARIVIQAAHYVYGTKY